MNSYTNVRDKFAYFKDSKYIYFNSAATTIKLKKVQEKVSFLSNTIINNNLRSNYDKNNFNIENVRKIVADFLLVSKNNIVFFYSITEAMNKISIWLKNFCIKEQNSFKINFFPKNNIHNSLYLPFIENFKINIKSSKKIDIFLLNYISNINGEILNLDIINNIRKNFPNAFIILDCSQFNFTKIKKTFIDNIDFIGFSNHKLFGLQSCFSYISERFEKILKYYPFYGGGSIIDFDRKGRKFIYSKNLANRCEIGTMNPINILTIEDTVKFIKNNSKIYFNNIYILKKYFIKAIFQLKDKYSNFIINIEDYSIDKAPIYIFKFSNIDVHSAAEIYINNKIILRTGQFCNNIFFSNRNIWLRISLNIYNTIEEIEKFIKLTEIILQI